MKMVKSLLLGSAAGLVAMAGAQAADLPVKAAPVEYVKVCTVYGVGFYYIPGTDTCIKVGGYVRMDIGIFASGSHGPYFVGGAARDNRHDTPFYQTRTRGVLSLDARSQTEWGTLRAYIRAGWEMNSSTTAYGVSAGFVDTTYRGATYWDRAFMQFAGLTVGKTQSFFDFYANALNYVTLLTGGSDTGHGINLLAYTMTFGGGFSATISLEDTVHRRTGIWDATTQPLIVGSANLVIGPPNYGAYAAQTYPDVVANVRVDQPWGSAQIMAALHNAQGTCYGGLCNDGPGLLNNGPDAFGWAVGAGVMFNLPWAQGDQFWAQATYARGAASYLGLNKFVANDVVSMTRGGAPFNLGGDGNTMQAWAFDGVFQTPSLLQSGNVELTEGFQVTVAAQHYWTPALRTSVFGGYVQLDFPGDHNAVLNVGTGARGAFCTAAVNQPAAGAEFIPLSVGGCDPSFAVWSIGTRTVWSPVRNLDIGVEVLYQRLDQNMDGLWNLLRAGGRAAGNYESRDQDTWSGLIRFQRNFWP
jgi:Porin subfamily